MGYNLLKVYPIGWILVGWFRLLFLIVLFLIGLIAYFLFGSQNKTHYKLNFYLTHDLKFILLYKKFIQLENLTIEHFFHYTIGKFIGEFLKNFLETFYNGGNYCQAE